MKDNKKIGVVFCIIIFTLMFTTTAFATTDINLNDGSTGREVVTWKNTFEITESGDNIILEYKPKYTIKYYDGKNDVMDFYLSSSERTPTDSEISSSVYIIKIPRSLGTINREITIDDLFYFDNDDDYEEDFRDERTDNRQEWSYYSYLDWTLASDYDAYRNYCTDAQDIGQTESQLALEDVAMSCIKTFNNSITWQDKINNLTEEKSDYKTSSGIYQEERNLMERDYLICSNNTEKILAEKDKIQREKISCDSDLNRANSQKTSCVTIQKDLDEAEKKNSNTMFMSFIAGVAACHFFTQKKKSGPSEHSETGSYADSPSIRPPVDHSQNSPPDETPRQ